MVGSDQQKLEESEKQGDVVVLSEPVKEVWEDTDVEINEASIIDLNHFIYYK